MSEIFQGTVDIQDGSGNTTVLLDGTRGALNVGGGGQDGTIHVDDAARYGARLHRCRRERDLA